MGTYVEFPAQIIVDPTAQESVLSTQFACSHNVPCHVLTARSRPRFRLRPCSCSNCRWMVSFKSAFQDNMYSTRCDVLLGADWLAACQPRFLHGGILRPFEASLGRLPIGHSWVPIPVSEGSCQRACLFFGFVCLPCKSLTNPLYRLSHPLCPLKLPERVLLV